MKFLGLFLLAVGVFHGYLAITMDTSLSVGFGLSSFDAEKFRANVLIGADIFVILGIICLKFSK
jgi:hypothetical protein